jgi:hypothetical protein
METKTGELPDLIAAHIAAINAFDLDAIMATFADDALVNSLFPADNVALSERWARSRYTDLRYYSTPAHGGHFAAYEAPGEFVAEVRVGRRALSPASIRA